MNKRLELVFSIFWRWLVHACIVGTFSLAFLVAGILVQVGAFQFSAEGNPHYESTYSLHVKASGETVYTAARNVSRGLRREIMGTRYPTPDAALEAVTGPLAGNPAYAHAVLVCYHSTLGKSTRQTGGGDHFTWWRKDYNSYRYTTTQHRILTASGGYQPTDTFKIRVRKAYCS